MEFKKLVPVGLGEISAATYHIETNTIVCGTDDGESIALIHISEPKPKIVSISGFHSAIPWCRVICMFMTS